MDGQVVSTVVDRQTDMCFRIESKVRPTMDILTTNLKTNQKTVNVHVIQTAVVRISKEEINRPKFQKALTKTACEERMEF